MSDTRLSYEASCVRLQDTHLEAGVIPPIPDRLPRYDDEVPGVSFFRTFIGEGIDLGSLALPRTFFGRSEINDVQFTNTDLSESNLCWNNFIDVDFTNAILTGSDLRSSLYVRVKFIAADLSKADLRLSSFESCDFTAARMEGTVITIEQGKALGLSEQQWASIAWTSDNGEKPSGG